MHPMRTAIMLGICVTCLGTAEAGTIRGTQHNDVITGTKGADTIYGLGGYDKINGAGGNDTIYGGPIKDVIRGGTGNDRMFGQGGNDLIYTDYGADYADGGIGDDRIYAIAFTGWQPGMAWGQAGGASTVLGGPGNDSIRVVGRGIDAYGGDGDDSLAFYSGPDENAYLAPFGAARWTGGAGHDTISIRVDTSPNSPALFVSVTDFHQGEDTLDIVGFERFANLAEMIALFDVNHDGHLSAAGDGLLIVNGNCQATFKTNAAGKVIGLELKLLGQDQIWLQGVADLAP